MRGIADTGLLVAFANRNDRYHDWAVRIAESVTEPLLTCEAVLAEAAFHLQSVSIVLAMVREGLVTLAFDSRPPGSAGGAGEALCGSKAGFRRLVSGSHERALSGTPGDHHSPDRFPPQQTGRHRADLSAGAVSGRSALFEAAARSADRVRGGRPWFRLCGPCERCVHE